jgi:hypothetical protein
MSAATMVNPTTNSSAVNLPHAHHRPHFATIPNEAISILTPYSGLLMTIWLVILFFIKNWILEPFIFPRYYRQTLSKLSDGDKRGFLVHHISCGVKILLLIVGAKPFCDVVFGKSTLHDPFSRHHPRPTMGDILLVLTQLFVALYVFELFTRKKVSPIASFHHVGAILIAQSAVVLSLDLTRQLNASMEYVLCLVWAAFDVLSETWLNIAMIIYRLYPENHSLLAYVFGSLTIINICGTFAETVMVMTLFGQSWAEWELDFKIVTPILHCLFTVAQLHTSRIIYILWEKEKKRLYDQERHAMDPEAGKEEDPKAHPAMNVNLESEPREDSITHSTSDTRTEESNPKPKSKFTVWLSKFFTGR